APQTDSRSRHAHPPSWLSTPALSGAALSGRPVRFSPLQAPAECLGQVPTEPPPAGLRPRVDLHAPQSAGLYQLVRVLEVDRDQVMLLARLFHARVGVLLGRDLAAGPARKLRRDLAGIDLGDLRDDALPPLLAPAMHPDRGPRPRGHQPV